MLQLLALVLAAAPAPQGDVALFNGAPGGEGTVIWADTSGAAPPSGHPVLAGVRLLPVDFNGRVDLDRLRLDRPRLVQDVPGASRIALQQARGSLYRHARVQSGVTWFGYFLVDPSGEAHVLLELPGTGPSQEVDPFTARVAIDAAASAMLVGTTAAAGGDLLEVDLDQRAVTSRSASLPPLLLGPGSLALGPSWGIAATSQGVYRFDRQQNGDAAAISFPGGPPWHRGEVVLSPSGTFAAVIAGTGPGSALPFVIGPAGAAVAASDVAQPLSGAGFLPDAGHGPYLAVSDDGTRCAWRVELPLSREAFLARVQATPQIVQVTDDAYFVDTIDEIGQFIFRPGTQLLRVAVGERADLAPYQLEKLDLFAMDLTAGGGVQITNLSMSSGVAQPPFQPAELDPENGLFWIPEAQAWFLHHSASGGGGQLLRVNASGGMQVLMADAKELELIERAGPRLALTLRRSTGNKDREVRLLDPATLVLSPSLLTIPDTQDFLAVVPHPSGAFLVVHRGAQAESLWRCAPSAASLALMINRPLLYADPIGWTPAGGNTFSVGSPLSIFAHWPPGASPQRIPVPPSRGFVLPGL